MSEKTSIGPAEGSYLVLLGEDGADETRKRLRREVSLIGSRPGLSVRLLSPEIAEIHCGVLKIPHGYVISDLGSGSGTLLNGEPVQTAMLRDGDVIGVGHYSFRFQGGPDAEGPAT